LRIGSTTSDAGKVAASVAEAGGDPGPAATLWVPENAFA
jgi:hypothetical protein